MRSIPNLLLKLIPLIVTLLLATAAYGQSARIQFERLSGLESKARDVVEVNIEGKILDLAKRVLIKVNDPDAKKVGQAIAGLQAIYVRAYKFEKEGEYDISDVDAIRAELSAPGWEKLANVRSKRNNQKLDVYTMFTGKDMSGVAVVLSESKSVAVINVIGPIDIDLLTELSGRMNVPKFEIESEKPQQH